MYIWCVQTRQTSPREFTSEAVTNGVRVQVRARYAPDHSEPAQQRWTFLYHITISNEGCETVQLISRHWIITDASEQVQEVKGLGVVERQPTLAPGESFEYTSGCPLGTPLGSMQGTYQMVTSGGESFAARIAPFALSGPYTLH